MKTVETIIIGAGQCGLAMSHELARACMDHVILERGQIGNSWRHERWDSLRMLTPNRMNGIAGLPYDGPDPSGFMDAAEFAARLDRAADANGAPVRPETTVLSVTGTTGGYLVQTDQGAYRCTNLVMANGACAKPRIPDFAASLPPEIENLSPLTYKRPTQLRDGKVLVVGASASGQQIARELRQAGRDVFLAVGNHLRLPRRYRGEDITTWLEAIGAMTTPYTEVDDLARVRRTPSLSLVAGDTLDLNVLQDMGVEITGRLAKVDGGRALFSGSLANACTSADLKLNRLLDTIDGWVAESFLDALRPGSQRFLPTRVPKTPRLIMDLEREGVGTIIWATGYAPDFSWLNLPVFDRKGHLLHDGGVLGNGLYVMGLPYLRQRNSTHIAGAAEDAKALAADLVAATCCRAAA